MAAPASGGSEDAALYLQVAGVLLFGGACIILAMALARARTVVGESHVPAHLGRRMRRHLLAGFLVACSLRFAGLLAGIICCGTSAASLAEHQTQWLWQLVEYLPEAAFLSALSILALLWAQVHSTFTIAPLHTLTIGCITGNVMMYVFFAAIAVLTYVRKAVTLKVSAECLLSLFGFVLAVVLIYYGIMVLTETRRTARKKLPERQLPARTLTALIVCPLALITRVAVTLFWRDASGCADIVMCLVSEWLPAAVVIATVRPCERANPKIEERLLDVSTDDSSTLEEEAAPPAPPNPTEWKLIYPPPV
eukprot:NODE_12517_length_1220_cov_6.881061.p1 GENE.NODE_12517_length_1220_cov_6.881061~~NODE_12517_length_1220_cov_6.881061.p1  ORF type:complete len:323 (+),score=104.67 NODE_12517_length_1220_cov_6.881061:48-971(+)